MTPQTIPTSRWSRLLENLVRFVRPTYCACLPTPLTVSQPLQRSGRNRRTITTVVVPRRYAVPTSDSPTVDVKSLNRCAGHHRQHITFAHGRCLPHDRGAGSQYNRICPRRGHEARSCRRARRHVGRRGVREQGLCQPSRENVRAIQTRPLRERWVGIFPLTRL